MCEIGMAEASQWSETKRVVKRRATCSACGTRLVAGAEYFKHFSVCEGRVCNESICLDCYRDRDEFVAAHDAMIPPPAYFVELLDGCIDEDDEESESTWKPMRARITARYEAARANA